ncbi:hypothetical protein QUF58_10510 [Anaerolineales bacterium HSG24]|nr:hypothetical protein [Anaerolineales bacterium HSG24]
MKRQTSQQVIMIIIFLLAMGITHRLTSFVWNTRIQGDVNLFALTAREVTNNSRLFYPMKYEYSDQVDYLTLSHPAVQHPPLFPFVAGLLGKLFNSDDTFFFLKLVCLSAGTFLLVAIAVLGVRNGWHLETALALLMISLSPIIADYSANGSSYIISALLITAATYLSAQFRYDQLSNYVLVAILCGLGLQLHGALVSLPAAFTLIWLINIRRLRWAGVFITAILGLLLLTPWMAWTYSHFGRLFYTYSTLALRMSWGLAVEGVFDDIVTVRTVAEVDGLFIQKYIPAVFETYLRFWLVHFLEVGPFCWLLAIAGGWYLFQSDKKVAMLAILPAFIYSILPAATTILRIRYIIPILPLTYLFAAWGFTQLLPRYRRLAVIGFVGTLMWFVPQFLETPLTRYYLDDFELSQKHASMVELSTALGQLEPGVVMGRATHLVGGVETVYWHRFPYVRGRIHSLKIHQDYSGQILHKLADDFEVRYIWADDTTVEEIKALFPAATIILNKEPFYVFERPQIE